ncbi:GGDEF domain-containing protein [Scandinavium lactucae]|uniref:diguanylate cyclase n=1 Tax=Scandinavium lactucae TaxID=3095028 RepID=A0ABU4QU55_9ENTR|nr:MULTISPECIES: GGDEF domain-containing protein [unclassified Scandinavium]MDX6040800.1 GGDEF domain-containing protein [Scandinavium sp. V105_6]MDX6051704.1 GGDEF domain-containing protein [Scandinavium sp. V105_1]
MKNTHQLKSEKKIFVIVLLVMLVIVNAFTLFIAFSSAKTNIELVTSRVVDVINQDTQNNRSIASDLGAMLQLPDRLLNQNLGIDIKRLIGSLNETPGDREFPVWKADIDMLHRKKFTILRTFWRNFSNANKSRFTTYYTDGDTGYYYMFNGEKAVKIKGSNPHFRITGYIDTTSKMLKNNHGFVIPELFYSNVYEDAITHLPTITIGSPVVINNFSVQSSKMSGIIATDYTRPDLSGLFRDAFTQLNLQHAGYDIGVHSQKGNDVPMNIFPDNTSWLSFALGDIKLMNGFCLSARVHFTELLRIKLSGLIIANMVMLFFFLIFIRSHKRIESMMVKLTTDTLTQALSREGGKIVTDNISNGRNTILVTMDLNDFKVINDTWGHHAGDEALVFFANYLLQSVRQGDYLIRMGGDEFVLLLQHTTLEQARRLMDQRMAELRAFPFEDTSIPLSFSYGISEWQHDFTESFKKADENLYQMKKQRKQKNNESYA